jgi:DNA-binding LytR/AlgR family response regulator
MNDPMEAPHELRAIVVDDEPLARDELIFLLGQCEGVAVVGEAEDAKTALALLSSAPDVAFVDLRMPGPDGIALAEAIRSHRPETRVVVVSAHDDAALRAFEARVADYLLKPVRLERLRSALERVRELGHDRIESDDSEAPLTRLAIKRRGGYVVVPIDDVIYFEMRDELVWAVTETDRYALDLTMSTVEKRLPTGPFFRSHRGALVRVDRIVKIEPSGPGSFDLVLDHPDAPRVPLARERARTLRALIPVAG